MGLMKGEGDKEKGLEEKRLKKRRLEEKEKKMSLFSSKPFSLSPSPFIKPIVPYPHVFSMVFSHFHPI